MTQDIFQGLTYLQQVVLETVYSESIDGGSRKVEECLRKAVDREEGGSTENFEVPEEEWGYRVPNGVVVVYRRRP